MRVAALRSLATAPSRGLLLRSRRALCTATGASVAAPEPGSASDKGGKAKVQKEKTPKGSNRQPKQSESTSSAEDIRVLRLQKVQDMRQAGVNPFEYRFDRSNVAGELQFLHTDLQNGEELAEVKESVAGRVLARRVLGKLAFLSLQARLRRTCRRTYTCSVQNVQISPSANRSGLTHPILCIRTTPAPSSSTATRPGWARRPSS